jgi:hypothetical protein
MSPRLIFAGAKDSILVLDPFEGSYTRIFTHKKSLSPVQKVWLAPIENASWMWNAKPLMIVVLVTSTNHVWMNLITAVGSIISRLLMLLIPLGITLLLWLVL